jgi:alkanesulfonate monooxygenase
MTIQTYWQLDVAAQPGRSEPGARPQAGTIFRDVRTGAINHTFITRRSRATAQTAFDGLFLPHRPEADDSAIVATAIAREVPRLTLVPEFAASIGSAVYAAKQAVSFQRATHDRLGWAITPAADAEALDRTAEFLTVVRGVHNTRPFSFSGTYFEVHGGGFDVPLNRVPFPRVLLQGESEETLALSARAADVHLFSAAPIAHLRSLIGRLDGLAAGRDRSVAFGVIQPVLVRRSRRGAARSGTGWRFGRDDRW